MRFIGVDPGKSGALSIIREDGKVDIYPFDREVYRNVLSDYAKVGNMYTAKCCVEHVGAAPKQGVVSMFSFGENFGFIQGLLTAFQIPYELVRPAKWKKAFSVTKDKNTSIEVCKRLFPDADLKRTERCKKDDNNYAEATLLAEYCRRIG